MLPEAFKLGEQIKLHTFEFRLCPELWGSFSIQADIMQSLRWKEIKYLNEDGTDFNSEINTLPNDKGGIYLFIVKSDILPTITNYLVYIGRAQLTDNHSLRVRCKKYLNEYLNDKERPKITVMINYLKKHLYLKYAEIENNDLIVQLEAELINSILPPFNDLIPKKNVRQAVDAFNS